MTKQYTPTTEEVLGMLGSHLEEYGADCDMNKPGNSTDEIVDRWLAERDAEVAAKAWDRAILYIGLNPDLANQFLDTNPYRKAVQS